MNRRGFLTVLGLAPVAGVMAARDAMAGYAHGGWISGRAVVGQAFIGEHVGEAPLWEPLNIVRKLRVEVETFGVDNIKLAPAIPARPAEDESVVAQFESDLEFIRDEPGVAI
jgi:hypothetical protein